MIVSSQLVFLLSKQICLHCFKWRAKAWLPAPSSFTDTEIPVVKQFTRNNLIASGGFGQIYKVHYKGSCYAAKVPFPSIEREADFEHEYNFLKDIHDSFTFYQREFIVKFFLEETLSSKSNGKKNYMLLEHCEISVAEFARYIGPLPEHWVHYICVQVSLGLSTIHMCLRAIHFDLKSDNILITKKGRLKICDFGSAVYLDKRKDIIKPYCTTTKTLAPEIISNTDMTVVTTSADYWALGIMVYELLTNRNPFYNEGDEYKKCAIKAMILRGEINLPEEPVLTDEAQDFIRKLTCVDPVQRIHSYFAFQAHKFMKQVPRTGLCPFIEQLKEIVSVKDSNSASQAAAHAQISSEASSLHSSFELPDMENNDPNAAKEECEWDKSSQEGMDENLADFFS